MPLRRFALALVLFLVLLGVLSVGIHYFTQNNNLGTDFFIFWQSGRAVFLEHSSPYRDELTLQSQMAILKRLALPGEDHLAFAYPPFALFTIFPLTYIPFAWAQAIWISFLILILVTAFVLAYPSSPRWVGISFISFYPVFFGLILGNFVVLLAALTIFLLGRYLPNKLPSITWQIAFGFITAWLLIKPQFTWPFLLLLGLSGLQKRQWYYLTSAFISLIVLIILSYVIVPNWLNEWVSNFKYTAYNQSWPIATYLLNQFLPFEAALWLSAVLGIACLGVTGWLIFLWWRNKLYDLPLLAWFGFIGYLVHPRVVSYEQLTFLLPLVIWVCNSASKHMIHIWFWWFASLIISWIAIFIPNFPGSTAATEFPLLFHSFWIAWIFKKETSKIRS